MLKKILYSFFIIFIFSSCTQVIKYKDVDYTSTFSEFITWDLFETTKKVYLPRESNAIIVKFNNTYSDIPDEDTGYVISTESRRAIESSCSDDYEIEDVISSRDLGEASVIKMRENALKFLPENNSTRAAGEYDCTLVKENYKIGDERNLYVTGTPDDKKTLYKAVCKAVGKKCYIWFVDNNSKYVTESDIENKSTFDSFAKLFDEICELEETVCGSHIFTSKFSDQIINPFEKISIIVADLYGDAYNPNDEARVYGYFDPADVIKNYTESNAGQFIYIDSFYLKNKPEEIYSTLVHEYNHLLNYMHKYVRHGKLCVPAEWFTEMLSMVCEDLFQNYLGLSDTNVSKHRLFCYNMYYNYGFYNWNRDSEKLVYYSYPNAYAFGAYLVRNFGGIDLLRELATSEYVNEEAITEALKKLNIKKYFEEGIADFDYVFTNQFKILLNSWPDSDYTGYISLNKQIGKKSDDLYFAPVVLKQFKLGTKYESSPYFYKANKDGMQDLGAMGFSVHVAGIGLDNMYISVPKNQMVEWLLVQP